MVLQPKIETNSLKVKQSRPDMSIVLVCWNNKDYLKPCLHSIYEGNIESSFDIVVVDNGSTDGSQAMLQAEFPQVQLILAISLSMQDQLKEANDAVQAALRSWPDISISLVPNLLAGATHEYQELWKHALRKAGLPECYEI